MSMVKTENIILWKRKKKKFISNTMPGMCNTEVEIDQQNTEEVVLCS